MKLERFDKELTNQAVKEFNDCVKNPKIGIKKQALILICLPFIFLMHLQISLVQNHS